MGLRTLAALIIPAVLDIILSTLEFAVFTLDAWSDVEELVASINEKDPAWCVTISDTCQPLLEAEQVATASTRCTDGIRCPNALIGIVLIPTAVIIVLILLFIFEWWRDTKRPWQQPTEYHEKKKEDLGRDYLRLRKFLRLDDLDRFMTAVEDTIMFPCRTSGEDEDGNFKRGLWGKRGVAPDSTSTA